MHIKKWSFIFRKVEFSWDLWSHLQHFPVQFSFSKKKTKRHRKTPALFACSMKEVRSWSKEYWTRVSEASWLCWTSHSMVFFKNQVFHMQPNCMTSTVTQMQCSVARNMLILASSSWKTLVSMVNLSGYQYLQANNQRKEILQLYTTTCLYRLKAINSLLSWASPSSDHCNDFQTVFSVCKVQHHFSTANCCDFQPPLD